MDFLTILILLALFIAAMSILSWIVNARGRSTTLKSLKADMPSAKILMSHSDQSFLAIDFAAEKIAMGHGTYRKYYQFADIVEVEVVKDGTTVSSTNRGSQLAGATVGAIAFGGVGAIIGGLSGKSTTNNMISKLALRVRVDDLDKPLHEITVFDFGMKGANAANQGVSYFVREAETFATHLINVMRRTSETRASGSGGKTPSVPDAIAALWNLKKEGALSMDEFRQEKDRLLSGKTSGAT